MLTTEVPGGTEQSWSPPLAGRIATVIALGFLLSIPLVTLLIFTQGMTKDTWIALAVTTAAWGALAWRVLANSVTLAPQALVIRNIFATEHVPLAQITRVSFRRGRLTVTRAQGTAGRRITASAVYLGASRWSGLRTGADATAEVIAAAAGLPPPPPRKEIITRTWAWIMLVAAVACLGLWFYSLVRPSGSLALGTAGVLLYLPGLLMLSPGFGVVRDHHRKRPAQDAAGQQGHPD